MDINSLPSNSKKKQEVSIPKHENKVVVSNNVQIKKKSEINNISKKVLGDDIGNIISWVGKEIILPSLKRLADDTFHGILYRGEPTRPINNAQKSNAYWVSSQGTPAYKISNNRNYINSYDYNDLEFDSRLDADSVLSELCDMLERYQFVSVMDYYEVSGVTGYDYTADKWGWTDLTSAKIIFDRNGHYIIRFPKAIPDPRR